MTKRIFLSSSIAYVANAILNRIDGKGLKLAFINTAAEVEEGDLLWLEDSKNSLINAGFIVSEYTITGKSAEQINKDLGEFDVLFFSGGNQFYLLQEIEKSQSVDIIREFVNSGKIYIGESAGSEIAGNNVYSTYYENDVEKAPNLKSYDALGLVDFIVFPHWGSDYFKDKYLNFRMNHAYTENDKIILLTDFQYIEVIDDFYRIEEVEHKAVFD